MAPRDTPQNPERKSMDPKMQKTALYAGLTVVVGAAFVAGLFLTGGSDQKAPAEPTAAAPKPAGPVAESAYPKEPVTVYKSDFATEVGPEWGDLRPTRHRIASRQYFGDFYPGMNPVLTINNLPPHRLVRATFDLTITDSWDGSCTKYGPSIFDLSLLDERVLLHTTFCNLDFSDNMEQSFPDNYPCLPYYCFTMATEKQNLKLMRTFSGGTKDCSSVYHLELTFPHEESTVGFSFTTTIRDGSYKGYGIDNMKVEALGQFQKLSDEEMAKTWDDFGSAIPQRFWNAKWALAATGDDAVKYIEQHINDNIDLSDKYMQALANSIGSENDQASWNALYQLRNQGPKALPLIMSATGRSRNYFLNLASRQYQETPTATSATTIRKQRAVALLDVIHTAKALEFKERLQAP
jgi:hypothetical protein